MATKSILKSVKLKDRKTVKKFACAIENSQSFKETGVEFDRIVKDIRGEKISEIFKDYDTNGL
ncbi:MAG: hypothetical protein GX219_10280 [Tissierellia bacterium]|nr:hypothetical protein [Tissierellia bacterium]